MKATDVIKDLAMLIERDGNFDVEITPSYDGFCQCSRPITSIGGDGVGCIYISCDVQDVAEKVKLSRA